MIGKISGWKSPMRCKSKQKQDEKINNEVKGEIGSSWDQKV